MTPDAPKTLNDSEGVEPLRPPGLSGRGTSPHRAVAVTAAGTILSTLANVISTLVIPRMLGPACYGAFSLFVSFRETAVSLSQMGISASLARHVPMLDSRPEWPRVLGTLFALQTAIALALVVVATVLLKASLGQWATPLVLALATTQMVLGSVLGFIMGLAYGRNLIAAVTGVSVLGGTIGVVLIPPCFVAFGFTGAVAAGVIGQALMWSVAWWWTRPWDIGWPNSNALGQAFGLMAYGLQAFFGGLIWLLFTRAGSFILAATGQPMEEIGSFSAGFNPVVKLVAMVASGSGALLPGMVALVVAGNVLKARTWVSAQARYMTALAMLGVAAMGFVGVPLLVTVLGRKYLAVGTIAAFSVVAVFPLVLDMLARSVAVAWGHARLSVEVFVLVGVLFVGTGLGLVPAHGALGLVAAVIVASIGACTYSNVRLRMWTGVWALGWSWLLAIALGAPGAISFFVELSWPLRIGGLVGFCCYYALVLILLGITPLEEIQDFWRNLRHRGIEER